MPELPTPRQEDRGVVGSILQGVSDALVPLLLCILITAALGAISGVILGGLTWALILAAIGAVLGLAAWCAWAHFTSF